ncbi:MAG TPA: hypothetical protein VMM56_09930, partial [Planctomycetaceae bacterium]|nr:hypothetical protein [Planctomycetaceae bacterium]
HDQMIGLRPQSRIRCTRAQAQQIRKGEQTDSPQSDQTPAGERGGNIEEGHQFDSGGNDRFQFNEQIDQFHLTGIISAHRRTRARRGRAADPVASGIGNGG